MTQLTEARTTGSFGTLVDVVAAGGVLILSGAGLSAKLQRPIVIVNQGATRGDAYATG